MKIEIISGKKTNVYKLCIYLKAIIQCKHPFPCVCIRNMKYILMHSTWLQIFDNTRYKGDF